MACFRCPSRFGSLEVFGRISRAAARHAAARLRGVGLLAAHPRAGLRLAVCVRCPLRRVYGGEPYCGTPLTRKPVRDESTDGCGCPLNLKAADPNAHCPIVHAQDQQVGPCLCPWCRAERTADVDARTPRPTA